MERGIYKYFYLHSYILWMLKEVVELAQQAELCSTLMALNLDYKIQTWIWILLAFSQLIRTWTKPQWPEISKYLNLVAMHQKMYSERCRTSLCRKCLTQDPRKGYLGHKGCSACVPKCAVPKALLHTCSVLLPLLSALGFSWRHLMVGWGAV